MVFCKLFDIFGHMKEIWKDIPDYEGLYKMNNLGVVLNVKRGRIVKPKINDGKYYQIKLSKENKRHFFYVHRLLALLFLPNPDNLPQVNHKTEEKLKNIVYINDDGTVNYEKTSIEWCTPDYNCNYGTRNKRIGDKLLNTPFFSKPVACFSLNCELVKTYPSIGEASRDTGASVANISKICKYKGRVAKGFKWSYKHKSTIQLDDAPCEYDATYCIIPI